MNLSRFLFGSAWLPTAENLIPDTLLALASSAAHKITIQENRVCFKARLVFSHQMRIRIENFQGNMVPSFEYGWARPHNVRPLEAGKRARDRKFAELDGISHKIR